MNLNNSLSYYLGANSPTGFFSYFDHIIDFKTANHLYIIKGGPGTGKSTFMRRIAQAGADAGFECELVYCSSDPDSLDGVVFPALKSAIVDGTAPHIVDPKYPGAVDSIINLGDYWDDCRLRERREQIIDLSEKISSTYAKAYRFIGAAGFVQRDSCGALSASVNMQKLVKYVDRQCKKLLPQRGTKGSERRRFLTAITPSGYIGFLELFSKKCKTLISVDDKMGLSNLLLSRLRDGAVCAGYSVLSYYCPMSPEGKLEHLYIEELGLGILSSDDFHPYEGDFTKRIYTTRFVDKEPAGSAKARVRFNKKCERSLLSGAISSLEEAHEYHDKLEALYVDTMDFESVNSVADLLSQKLFDSNKACK